MTARFCPALSGSVRLVLFGFDDFDKRRFRSFERHYERIVYDVQRLEFTGLVVIRFEVIDIRVVVEEEFLIVHCLFEGIVYDVDVVNAGFVIVGPELRDKKIGRTETFFIDYEARPCELVIYDSVTLYSVSLTLASSARICL